MTDRILETGKVLMTGYTNKRIQSKTARRHSLYQLILLESTNYEQKNVYDILGGSFSCAAASNTLNKSNPIP